jgi:hypothetical protein
MNNENVAQIPGTEDSAPSFTKAGVYLFQPVRIVEWKDKNGMPKLKDGHPGLMITFKDVEDGAMISSGFYYSTLPMNDPRRQDPAYKCKSEYQLSNLKVAMGFDPTKAIDTSEFMKSKFWSIIKEVRYIRKADGEIMRITYDLNRKFFPYIPTAEFLGRPSIMGDPKLDKKGLPSGDFLEERDDLSNVAAPAAEPAFRPTKQAEPNVDSTGEENRGQDSPAMSTDINEAPDY